MYIGSLGWDYHLLRLLQLRLLLRVLLLQLLLIHLLQRGRLHRGAGKAAAHFCRCPFSSASNPKLSLPSVERRTGHTRNAPSLGGAELAR